MNTRDTPFELREREVLALIENGSVKVRRIVEGCSDSGKLPHQERFVYRMLAPSDYYVKPGCFQEGATHLFWRGAPLTQWHEINPYPINCPLGKVGDSVLGLEAWWEDRREPADHEYACIGYAATPELFFFRNAGGIDEATYIDDSRVSREASHKNLYESEFWRLRPALEMPRYACRFNLILKGVQVRRLQDITIDEIVESGIPDMSVSARTQIGMPKHLIGDGGFVWCGLGMHGIHAILWDMEHYHVPGARYDDNPFVWVYTLMVAEPKSGGAS